MNDGHPADGKEKRFSSLLKLFGRGKRDEDVTEEIMDMVNESHEQGVLEENEAEMIGNIFEFGEKQASDVMTHRNNIVALDDDITVREAFDRIMKENYSRYPVYDGDIDNITGILHIRDLLKIYVDKDNQDRKLRDVEDTVLFKPYCIPETRNISPLFRQMQSEKIHMAIVVDEYGGTAGLVTMEDILEEIVGDIYDEYDPIEEKYEKIDENTFVVDGQISIYDFEKLVGVKDIETECDTLSGYLMELMDRVPTEEENPVIETDKLVFKIEEFDERRIAKVKVCKINVSKKENDEDEEQE